MKSKLQKLIVILGSTASGKTELAVKLAKTFNGGIVSADSRQVYKGMDIGTAKPTREEIKKIPHYLINIIYPNQEFSVAIYKKMVLKAIKNIQKRKKLPFLVGGTGLYIQSIVDNIEFPRVPPQKKLREKFEKKTEKELLKIYKKLDPQWTKFIDKKNKRRLIRAIEVCKVTKKPFWQQRRKGKPIFDILQIGLKLPKNELKKRVEKRVEKMFKLGLEKEVKNLIRKYGWNISPLQTIGYQEWKEYFYPSPLGKSWRLKQKINKEELKEKIKLHTLQFAKRQITWFKKDKRIRWLKNQQQAEKLIKEFLK